MSSFSNNEILKLTSKSDRVFKDFVSQILNLHSDNEDDDVDNVSLASLLASGFETLNNRSNSDLFDVSVTHLAADPDNKITKSGRTLIAINMLDHAFIVDSLTGLFLQNDLAIDFMVHPILDVERGDDHKIKSLQQRGEEAASYQFESIVLAIVSRELTSDQRDQLRSDIQETLTEVSCAVQDWQSMRSLVNDVIVELRNMPPIISTAELAEAIMFLEWLNDNHFTYLGARELRVTGKDKDLTLDHIDGRSFGILRDPKKRVLKSGGKAVTLTPEIRAFLEAPNPLIVTKSDLVSKVHRLVTADYIGIKRFNEDGKVIGELRIIGLFTSTTYTQPVGEIPLLRRKQFYVLRKLGLSKDSHSGKALINILDNFPRSELFQTEDQELIDTARKLLKLYERPRVKIFLRKDQFSRYVTAQVFVPRERYNSNIRAQIGSALANEFNGEILEFEPTFLEAGLTRVYFVIENNTESHRDFEEIIAKQEKSITKLISRWEDRYLQAAAISAEAGNSISNLDPSAFTDIYRAQFDVTTALKHSDVCNGLTSDNPIAVEFGRSPVHPKELLLFIFKLGEPLTLSSRVPVLENMGLDVISEDTYQLKDRSNARKPSEIYTIYEMRLLPNDGKLPSTSSEFKRLEALLISVLQSRTENDGLNSLCLLVHLSWREIAILRIYMRHQLQLGVSYSSEFLQNTLIKNSHFSRKFVDVFHLMFDPQSGSSIEKRQDLITSHEAEMDQFLNKVESIEEDVILRRLKSALGATLRTNYYNRSDNNDESRPILLNLKLDPSRVDGTPSPRPYREIFVSGPEIEGVHMRFGPIARGGLRWSDRSQDFRTEVLGLVKAQQVKNAVIVPVGAKGGFIPRTKPIDGSREAFIENGVGAYKKFINSLLEITDNQVSGAVVPPQNVTAWDDEDPYLVVAADKGTATFSDTANAISQDRDFWLDDAFASGGSAGYDHKKMGITARGGWEAVKRHFREMDRDIQSEPFTAMGVGDMSGDVFGNGMLLSKFTRLQAAFDHRHIFIDPDPDIKTSFNERQRLFDLGRSSWGDYDSSLISDGGGVYSRSSKSITLSASAKKMLALEGKSHTPHEIMNAILKAEVDLLWFGGIGTYIRGKTETDAQVGDRNNDAIRITGSELNAKVIGEGANLGITQLGRIEFANNGGRVNTDAIDNSAGVNSSDVEVNIKIAFQSHMADGSLERDARNVILEEMTDRVGDLVLLNNYRQTLSLTLSHVRGHDDLGFQNAAMCWLDENFALDRGVEYLPDPTQMLGRLKRGDLFTRPELAVLLAYMKNALFAALESYERLNDDIFDNMLMSYFPERMHTEFGQSILNHPLRKGIIATELANGVINRGGFTYPTRLVMETGVEFQEVALAYIVARDSFSILSTFNDVENRDTKIASDTQLSLFLAIQNHLFTVSSWILRETDTTKPIADQVADISKFVTIIRDAILSGDVLGENNQKRLQDQIDSYEELGLEQAGLIAVMPYLERTLALYAMDIKSKELAGIVAKQFSLGEEIGLDQLAAMLEKVEVTSLYDRLALNRLQTGLFTSLSRLAVSQFHSDSSIEPSRDIIQLKEMITGLASGTFDIARLTVVAGMLDDLTKKTG